MKMIPMNVTKRDRTGTGAARAARRSGDIPGVLYGPGHEPLPLSMNARAFSDVVHGAQGEHAIVELSVADHPDLGGPAMLKDVQHHPVRGHIVHADLLRIDLSRKITTMVATKLEGKAKGIVEGGILEHTTREVEVSCLPTAIPDFLSTDITDLDVGHSLSVSALTIPEGVDLLTNPERVLVTILVPRVLKTETPGAAAEGAVAAGAEGQAPAADAAAKPAAGGKS